MKEHPILFSTQMVQAILQGRKTQTRRVVKTTEKGWDAQKMEFVKSETINESFFDNKHASPSLIKQLTGFHAFFKEADNDWKLGIKCPYGQPGDRLWVRETFEYLDRGTDDLGWEGYLRYVADEKEIRYPSQDCSPKRMPSIHMPKAAARIWLEIEEIKVERLQDISFQDAVSEGIEMVDKGDEGYKLYDLVNTTGNTTYAPDSFKSLWHSINGPESWHENPWVWVVKFKVLSTTGIHSITQSLNH